MKEFDRRADRRAFANDVCNNAPDLAIVLTLIDTLCSLESEDGLKKFQAGELPAKDEEWYKLVPEAAREALGKREVERQSVFFELFKAERDYVGDLEAVQEVRLHRYRSKPFLDSECIGVY